MGLDLLQDNRLVDRPGGGGVGLGEICSCIDAWLCSPRVLFMFETCSINVFTDDQEQTPGGFRLLPDNR